MSTRRTPTDGEQSAVHLAAELEQLLRTLHPLTQSDMEAVSDAIAYVMLLRECLNDVGRADDPGDVTLPPVSDNGHAPVPLWERRAISVTLLDTRIPQPSRERDYGVPDCIVEAAALLYRHRNVVPDEDVPMLDAAIVRLYRPWIRR